MYDGNRYVENKIKGRLGELAVTQDLIINDYVVFEEVTDTSKIDLVAYKDEKFYRIQVKSVCKKNNNAYYFNTIKKNGDKHWYKNGELDLWACYGIEDDCVAWLNEEEALSKNGWVFRNEPSKNNQTKNVKYFKDFSLSRILET
jgi:hypothetical protein